MERRGVFMIEIIKQGTKNRVECNNCGALLSYMLEDIKEEEKYVTQRDSYAQKYLKCPQCNNKIVLQSAR
jgi:ribosomal protein S27E